MQTLPMTSLQGPANLSAEPASAPAQGDCCDHLQVARLCHFGQFLMEKHEFSIALEKFNEAIELQRNSVQAWTSRGLALSKLGRYRLALDSFRRASDCSTVPETGLWVYQAQTLLKLGWPQLALEASDAALAIAPNHWAAQPVSFQALWALGCRGEAFRSLVLAVQGQIQRGLGQRLGWGKPMRRLKQTHQQILKTKPV